MDSEIAFSIQKRQSQSAMSWDIFVQDFPKEAVSVSDMPDGFQPASIGSKSEVVSKIAEAVPGADFSVPTWGVIDGNGWLIEINLGESDPCEGLTLHIRGGDEAIGAIDAILQSLRLRAIDSQTEDFFVAGPDARESFEEWRRFRNQVVGQGD